MFRKWRAWARRLVWIGVGSWIGLWLVPRLHQTWERFADRGGLHHHTGPSIEQLLPLSSLVTLRAEVSDVLETRLHGWTGGITAVLIVKGDVELSTDLSKARFEAVDEAERTAVLVLSNPVAGAARLDHGRTKLFALSRDGLWQLVPGDYADQAVVNQAYEEAQKAVASAAGDEGLREKARAQAERVLGGFFEAMNWRVAIRWVGQPS